SLLPSGETNVVTFIFLLNVCHVIADDVYSLFGGSTDAAGDIKNGRKPESISVTTSKLIVLWWLIIKVKVLPTCLITTLSE
ncbi:MAG: hypothetical protein ACXAAO_05985, partial [Candidatus Thorarchaeota archaeon]